jgi:general stress protein 26
MVRGTAELISDEAEKKRVWDVLDYDLSNFWSGGPTDPNYTAVRITPTRVELSKMFGSMDKRVWRAG